MQWVLEACAPFNSSEPTRCCLGMHWTQDNATHTRPHLKQYSTVLRQSPCAACLLQPTSTYNPAGEAAARQQLAISIVRTVTQPTRASNTCMPQCRSNQRRCGETPNARFNRATAMLLRLTLRTLRTSTHPGTAAAGALPGHPAAAAAAAPPAAPGSLDQAQGTDQGLPAQSLLQQSSQTNQ